MDAANKDEDDSSDGELFVPRTRTQQEQVSDDWLLSYSQTTATPHK